MADEPRDFIPKDPGERMLVFELASDGGGPSGPPTPDDEPLPLTRERRRRPSRKGLLAGIAAAVVLGATLGVLARPELIGEPSKMQPAKPAAEVEAVAVPQMQVAVREAPEAAEALQPPEAAATPPAEPTPAPPAERLPPDSEPAPPAESEPPAPSAAVRSPQLREPPPRLAARGGPPPRVRPSFDCRWAVSLAEEMVCGDPRLAAADRRLAEAYQRALAAGVPGRWLRAEQDDWLRIREQAARRSPAAVADVYEQRTAELNDMAIEAWDGF